MAAPAPFFDDGIWDVTIWDGQTPYQLGTYPLGYSAAAAIAMVRVRTNEPTYPPDATILTLLNAGIEQVSDAIGGIRTLQSILCGFPGTPGGGGGTSSLWDDPSTLWDQALFDAGGGGGGGSGGSPGSLWDLATSLWDVSLWDAPATPSSGGGAAPGSAGGPQSVFVLPPDVLDVISMSYSTAPQIGPTQTQATGFLWDGTGSLFDIATFDTPTTTVTVPAPPPVVQPLGTPGTTVYPLTMMDPGQFMNFSGGFPGTGFGPPIAYMIYNDQFNVLTAQLYPSTQVGQLNIYYRQRPQLWTDTQNSRTQLDTDLQEAVILWACYTTCLARMRGEFAKNIFKPELNDKIAELKERAQRRVTPKSGRVTDVNAVGNPAFPTWPGWDL